MKLNRALWKLCAVAVGAYLLLRVGAVLGTDYPWSDMDWNSDGFTTPFEVLRASDVGRREIVKDGQQCLEYFALKDAATLKVVCPES